MLTVKRKPSLFRAKNDTRVSQCRASFFAWFAVSLFGVFVSFFRVVLASFFRGFCKLFSQFFFVVFGVFFAFARDAFARSRHAVFRLAARDFRLSNRTAAPCRLALARAGARWHHVLEEEFGFDARKTRNSPRMEAIFGTIGTAQKSLDQHTLIGRGGHEAAVMLPIGPVEADVEDAVRLRFCVHRISL